MAWFSPRLIFTRIYSETWNQKVEWNCSLPLTEASRKLGPRQEIAERTTTINKKTNTSSWDQGKHAWREPQQWPIPPTGTSCKSFYKISPVKIGVLFQGDLLARTTLALLSLSSAFQTLRYDSYSHGPSGYCSSRRHAWHHLWSVVEFLLFCFCWEHRSYKNPGGSMERLQRKARPRRVPDRLTLGAKA